MSDQFKLSDDVVYVRVDEKDGIDTAGLKSYFFTIPISYENNTINNTPSSSEQEGLDSQPTEIAKKIVEQCLGNDAWVRGIQQIEFKRQEIILKRTDILLYPWKRIERDFFKALQNALPNYILEFVVITMEKTEEGLISTMAPYHLQITEDDVMPARSINIDIELEPELIREGERVSSTSIS